MNGCGNGLSVHPNLVDVALSNILITANRYQNSVWVQGGASQTTRSGQALISLS